MSFALAIVFPELARTLEDYIALSDPRLIGRLRREALHDESYRDARGAEDLPRDQDG